jgi:hypothetical protein
MIQHTQHSDFGSLEKSLTPQNLLQIRELRSIHATDAMLARGMLIVSATARDGARRQKRFGGRKLTNTIAKGPPYPVGS